MDDMLQLGTRDLLGILDRLRNQAEELLKAVKEAGTPHKMPSIEQESTPTTLGLKLQYGWNIPLLKTEYLVLTLFLDSQNLFLLYADDSFQVYNVLTKMVRLHNSLPLRHVGCIQPYNSSSIIFFHYTRKQIIVLDLENMCELSNISVGSDALAEETLQFRFLHDQIILISKEIQPQESQDEEGSHPVSYIYKTFTRDKFQPNQASQMIGECKESTKPSLVKWTYGENSKFSLGICFCNKMQILRTGNVILYSSFTRNNENFYFCEYKDGKVAIRQRASLLGQVMAFFEFEDNNKIAFLVNVHQNTQFKCIVHDPEQNGDMQISLNFIGLTKNLLLTGIFCFFQDRYLGLELQDFAIGARNVIYDTQSQHIIAVIQGHHVTSEFSDHSSLQFLVHTDNYTLEESSLKLIKFIRPQVFLMKLLEDQGILNRYGQLACKEIIDMTF